MNNEIKTLSLVKMFEETQSIKSQLPILLDDFEIAELFVTCPQCSTTIKQELIHGYANKPLANTASFHAVSVCHSCKHITESVTRIKKTGKYTVRYEKLSQTGKWLSSELSLRDNHWFIALLKRIFQIR